MDDLTLQLFFEEAAEAVRGLEEGLLQLERAPQDAETLNRILRGVHTLKGTGAMLGFEAIVRFAHVLEDALTGLRGRSSTAPLEHMDLLLASADVLDRLLQRARDRDSREVERLDEVTRGLRAIRQTRQLAPPEAPGAPGAALTQARRFTGSGSARRRTFSSAGSTPSGSSMPSASWGRWCGWEWTRAACRPSRRWIPSAPISDSTAG